LRFIFIEVQLTGMVDCIQDRIFSQIVEQNTINFLVLGFDFFRDVPGNCLPFTIRIGSNKEAADIFRCLLKIGKDLFLVIDDAVCRLKLILGIDAQGLLGQVLDMSLRSQDLIVRTEIFF
jgi:hypothetical protein